MMPWSHVGLLSLGHPSAIKNRGTVLALDQGAAVGLDVDSHVAGLGLAAISRSCDGIGSTFISSRTSASPVSIPGSTIRELKRQAKQDAKAAALREKAAKLRLDASKLEAKAARSKAKAQELEGQANRMSKRPIQLPAAPPKAPVEQGP